MPEYEIVSNGAGIIIEGFLVDTAGMDLDSPEVKKAICQIKTWIDEYKTEGITSDDCTFTIDIINNKVQPAVEFND